MKRLLFMGVHSNASKKSRVKGYVLKAVCALVLSLLLISPLSFSTAFAEENDVILVTGVALDHESVSLVKGDTAILTAAVSPGDATDQTVTWSSSDVGIASVDNYGVVTAVSAGEAVITVTTVATEDGTPEGAHFTAQCTVTVTQPVIGISIDPSPLEMCPGDTFTLSAVIDPPDATETGIAWSSSDIGIVSVHNGDVTANALGSADITAASLDGIHFAVCTVTVVSPSITSSVYTIDAANGIIPGISKFTSSGQFFSNLDNNPADLSTIKPGGSVYSGIGVGTSMSVRLTVNGTVRDTLKLITSGDGNGDGAVSITDYTLARLHILGLNMLTDVFRNACDINGDGEITITDYTLIRLDILGLKPISIDTPVLPEVSDPRIRAFIDVALAQRGKPYVLGAEGPDSFDCSGYIYYCLKQSGYSGYLWRATADTYSRWPSWPSVLKDQLQPGDFMFFYSDTPDDGDHIGHIGIYLGNGYLIHASSTYGCIIICPVSGWYKDSLSHGRRAFY